MTKIAKRWKKNWTYDNC